MNYKITIGYDGSKYSGWQRNKNADNTIQDKLDKTLSKYFGETVQVIGAGRTDKGVHAIGMTANFHLKQPITLQLLQQQPKSKVKGSSNAEEHLLEWIRRELNDFLPMDIVIHSFEIIEERFHSRFSARGKCYQYTFVKAYQGVKPLFDRPYVALVEEEPDLYKMKEGAQRFIGKHDFKGFSSDRTKKSTVRTITDIQIEEMEDRVVVRFYGDGFLYHMIRIIMGTLLEIGLRQRSVESIDEIFESGDRSKAGYLVPASGLALVEVYYE